MRKSTKKTDEEINIQFKRAEDMVNRLERLLERATRKRNTLYVLTEEYRIAEEKQQLLRDYWDGKI